MSGEIKYLPEVVLQELEDIKREDEIIRDVEAMQRMVEYTRIGREVKRLMTLDFRFKPTRNPK